MRFSLSSFPLSVSEYLTETGCDSMTFLIIIPALLISLSRTDRRFDRGQPTDFFISLKLIELLFPRTPMIIKEDNVFTGFCMGEQLKDRIRKRSDIGKEQIVCVTNSIGRVGAAFLNYKHGVDLKNSTEIVRIEPRIHEAMELSKYGARFMMDISDGLFGSISQMRYDYGIGFRIVQSELPLHQSVFKASERYGISALEIGCNIGGDYELLFTIENDNYGDFSKKMNELGIQVSYIGTTWDGDNMIFDGEMWNNIDKKGWDNFSKEY